MSNHLKKETSPYLLQHAENPVNWYAWSDEAFRKAKEEDKPVFLSIGYSTCHWCHVMAHESFEDEEIASILNKHFISVKVDKEERPDIDSIYMAVCQAFTGSGGWPTSIFMTPEQKPFFAGTYFPPTSRGGMVGLQEVLLFLQDKWTNERSAIINQAEQAALLIKPDSKNTQKREEQKWPQLLDSAVAKYKRRYDRENGGFGRAPKFPTPHNILFLLSYYQRYKDADCLQMAQHTLLQMYKGGMFDHIGFGFCRYSTDAQFLVPHFEKMLYDNALLILAYCEGYSCTKNPLFLEIAEKTAAYILREMTSPEGGFYSAQDADSDGEEGKYYTFSPDEIVTLLGKDDGDAFNRHFGISKKGNFEGKNIPNLLHSDVDDKSFDKFFPQIEKYRKCRCSLHLDDKILTCWNGLMIAAMCRLYMASGKDMYLMAAKRADVFIQEYLSETDSETGSKTGGDCTLFVSYRAGKHGVKGFLDDYAAYIFAQIALYSATFDAEYLTRAKDLCRKVMRDFRDEQYDRQNNDNNLSEEDAGGFYLYSNDSEKLIVRPKETYDGAIPSGNSLMALNFVRLAHLTPDEKTFETEAVHQLNFMTAEADGYPLSYAMFLFALLEYYEMPMKVTVVPGDSADKVNSELRDRLAKLPSDAAVVILEHPTDEFPLINNKTTFYVCRDHSCLPPSNEI